ncbi:Hypothetical protein A7982_08567 [Minicystis rosea]|nr:Hypothetical protein A7982_08567 [Minicystis rosea]
MRAAPAELIRARPGAGGNPALRALPSLHDREAADLGIRAA